MHSEPLLQAVQGVFAELGADDETPIHRTFLLRDRRFVGHCFRCGDLRAVWKLDGSVVEFFAAAGQLLRVVNLSDRKERDAA